MAQPKNPKRVVIDRSKWRCGQNHPGRLGKGPTEMLNDDGFMCCLGQRAKLHRCAMNTMRGAGNPGEVFRRGGRVPAWMIRANVTSPLAEQMINVNDAGDVTREQREQMLIELAKQVGEEWVFEGEYTQGDRT